MTCSRIILHFIIVFNPCVLLGFAKVPFGKAILSEDGYWGGGDDHHELNRPELRIQD